MEQIKNPKSQKTYILETFISEGGFGKVYKGYNKDNKNKPYAIKRIEMKSNELKKLIEGEINILSLLKNKCENIVKIEESFIIDTIYYIVMEYIDGFELTELYDTIKEKNNNEDYIMAFFEKSIRGLQCIHKNGIIHKDIKPGNIMYVNDENIINVTIKFIDFGLACLLEQCQETSGTLKYMAPEILYKNYPVSFLSDIYSLGVTFLVLFDPNFQGFQGKNLIQKKFLKYINDYNFPKMPRKLEIIIKEMMRLDPALRPNTEQIIQYLVRGTLVNITERKSQNEIMLNELKDKLEDEILKESLDLLEKGETNETNESDDDEH